MMGNSVILKVGEMYHLKQGRDRIYYAGMPNDDVYSIVQRKQNGYQGYSWNLFFPRHKRDIAIDGVPLYVESVGPDEIILRVA